MSEIKYVIDSYKAKHNNDGRDYYMYRYKIDNIVAESKLWYPSHNFVIADAAVTILAMEKRAIKPGDYYESDIDCKISIDDNCLEELKEALSVFALQLI